MSANALTTRACPQCAAPIETDPRFADWCRSCEWNLAPAPDPSRRVRSERSRARDRARVERLYTVLAARPAEDVQHRSGAWLLAVLLATLVHLSTVALLAGSVWLLVTGYLVLKVVGAVGLGLTWVLRPRFGRWKKTEPGELTREQAPVLHAVVARTAAALGTPVPDRITVSDDYNASYSVRGLRRRVRLTLGLPLWTVLAEDERLALLGHELGHGSNGDVSRGLWVGLAGRTLTEWCGLLLPNRGDRFRMRTARQAANDRLSAAVLWLLAQPLLLLLWVLGRLTERSSQQAEYLADERAAVVASSAVAGRMLGKLSLGDSVLGWLQQRWAMGQLPGRGGRAGRAGAAADDGAEIEALWTGLREYLDSMPPAERERRSRLSAREMSAVDTNHPPSHLRVRMRSVRPERAAAVAVDGAEWAAIEAELAPARQRIGRLLLGR